ncbi:L,D-transpeptidase family protein [Kordia sp. TARA_039_SRF]|nr:L,D-transpeptidase family protein [Kordia sp. TARA_039_SRF]
MKIAKQLLIAISLMLIVISCKNNTSAQEEAQIESLQKILPIGSNISILIDKSDYTLSVISSDTLVKTYNVVFGGNPVDDKEKEGDQRTPEGEFGVRDKYPHRKWSKFIWIDYPNANSWKKFKQRKAAGVIKEGETIGGEVGIHGVPEGMNHLIDNRQNWTLGCISMKNNDVNEIYPYITDQTKITIQK